MRPPTLLRDCPGDAAVHDLQLSQLPTGSFRPLTHPVPIFEFNFRTVTPKKRNEIKLAPCIATGLAQAVCMWWELKMDVDHEITLSCAPYWAHPDLNAAMKGKTVLPQNAIPWRDHWLQAIYYLPQSNNLVGEGRDISIYGYHDEFSLWFEAVQDTLPQKKKPMSQSGLHNGVSRTRIGQLNDNPRNKKLILALDSLELKGGRVLSLSQGCSLTGLAAATFNLEKLLIIEPHNLLHPLLHAYIRDNRLQNVHISRTFEENVGTFSHIIAEPFYISSILPWDNFAFFQFLFNHDVDKEKIKISPIKAKILAMPVKFLNLHKIDDPIRCTCEGLNLDVYDTLIESASKCTDPDIEAHPLWEYPCSCEGDIVELLEIDATKLQGTYEVEGIFDVEAANGVALWVDWQLYDSEKAWISSGPNVKPENGQIIAWNMYNRQGVRFTRGAKVLKWKLTYCVGKNECEFKFS